LPVFLLISKLVPSLLNTELNFASRELVLNQDPFCLSHLATI